MSKVRRIQAEPWTHPYPGPPAPDHPTFRVFFFSPDFFFLHFQRSIVELRSLRVFIIPAALGGRPRLHKVSRELQMCVARKTAEIEKKDQETKKTRKFGLHLDRSHLDRTTWTAPHFFWDFLPSTPPHPPPQPERHHFCVTAPTHPNRSHPSRHQTTR